MKWVVAVASASTMVLLGCGSGSDARQHFEVVAECVPQLRFEGTIYIGMIDGADQVPLGDEVGKADMAVCDDTGRHPRGPYFPSDPDQAEVWALDDYPTSELIGVQRGPGLSVFANTDMSRARFESVTDELRALIEQGQR